MILRGAFVAPTYSKQSTKKYTPEILILSVLKLPLCELLGLKDMSTYMFTEGRNFKPFLKENYAISLDSCYMFTEKC